MGLKGQIQDNHFPTNKYEFIVAGLPPLTPTKVGGISEELDTVELPDQTRVSGGGRKATEVTMSLPLHHIIQQAAVEAWYKEGQGNVSPTYKKTGTLVFKSVQGTVTKAFTLMGCFITKRSTSDLEMGSQGDMVETEFTISIDEVIPI
jgi:hypothetical protein